MATHYNHMPVDRTVIKTRLRIHPDLLKDPSEFIRKHSLKIRTSKPSLGTSKRGPTRNLNLDVLTYKGIKVKLRNANDDPLTEATIDFNPCVCLRGHNGLVITLSDFLDASAILVTHLKPLLKDQNDWVDLIPGLRSGGFAYWHCIEIQLQCTDPDGKLLAGFRSAQRRSGQTSVRHWPESIVIGSKDSKLRFSIYRKAVEMVAKNKLTLDQLEDTRHILRLEVRLKKDMLVRYLGNERNIEKIDGIPRLVRFYPGDLVSGLRTGFGDLQGVYFSAPVEALKPKGQLDPLGRLLARVALDPRCTQTFLELFEHLRFYTGASSDTMGPIKQAGARELARLSPISKDDIFSDKAFGKPHHVASVKPKRKVLHEIEDTFVHPLIHKAYCPPDQPFQPMTQWPGYLRMHA